MEKVIQQEANKRLKIIQGHLRKISQMVEDDAYCIDILQQTLAVQSSIKRVEEVILAGHLKNCVSKAVKGPQKMQSIKEVLEIFQKARR